MSAEPLAIVTSADQAEELCAYVVRVNDQITRLSDLRMFALTALLKLRGEAMLAEGRRSRTIGAYRLYAEPPAEKIYCACHMALPHQCPTPLDEREPYIVRKDARPSLYVTRVKEDD